MILSDQDIRAALRDGQVEIWPAPKSNQFTTSAVDLFLGEDFQVWDERRLKVPGLRVDLNLAEQKFQSTAAAYLKPAAKEPDGSLVLSPYTSTPLLGITQERVHLKPDSRLAARVEGRSSFARLGLVVHLTAPTIHAGFDGKIALEIINFGPFHLRLVPFRTRICQLILERLESVPSGAISTAFQGQSQPSGN